MILRITGSYRSNRTGQQTEIQYRSVNVSARNRSSSKAALTRNSAASNLANKILGTTLSDASRLRNHPNTEREVWRRNSHRTKARSIVDAVKTWMLYMIVGMTMADRIKPAY